MQFKIQLLHSNAFHSSGRSLYSNRQFVTNHNPCSYRHFAMISACNKCPFLSAKPSDAGESGGMHLWEGEKLHIMIMCLSPDTLVHKWPHHITHLNTDDRPALACRDTCHCPPIPTYRGAKMWNRLRCFIYVSLFI